MPRRKTGTVKTTLQRNLRSQNRRSAAAGSSSPASSESSSSVASYPIPSTTSSSVLGPTKSGSNVTCAEAAQQIAQHLCAWDGTTLIQTYTTWKLQEKIRQKQCWADVR